MGYARRKLSPRRWLELCPMTPNTVSGDGYLQPLSPSGLARTQEGGFWGIQVSYPPKLLSTNI